VVITVLAHIELLSPEDGGRTLPVIGGTSYRPVHNFFGPANLDMANGSIELPDGAQLRPGEGANLKISFLDFPRLREAMRPGLEWMIQEGPRIVGRGKVLKIFDSVDRRE
jgi:translation elongation factor EF-Tu-like GTPase